MLKGQFYKKLGNFDLDLSLTVGNKELLVILGASGCGKSTLLNCLAGFMPIDRGQIELDKVEFSNTNRGCHVPIHERQIAYIQQGKTLFPHLSVKENILYSVRGKRDQAVMTRYQDLLKLLAIEDLEKRRPHTLSGGQQQRVAIGRALMMSPKLILWDEPFSALDHLIREDLRHLVLTLKETLSIPMIFVTHDLEEAFQLSDRLGIMASGRILQLGDRDKVFNSPVNARVGKILGISNILTATYTQEEKGKTSHAGKVIRFQCDDICLNGIDIDERLTTSQIGTRVQLGIRPEQILYVREDVDSIKPLTQEVEGNIFEATVLTITKHLENYRLKISIKGLRNPLMMDMPRGVIQRYDIYQGASISVLLKYKRLIVMNVLEDGQESLERPVKTEGLKEDQPLTRTQMTYSRYKKMTGPKISIKSSIVIGVAGVSNSGKTTVVTQLIKNLSDRGYKIGVIKHDGHGFDIDHPDKDSYRHKEAGARSVMIASKDKYAMIKKTPSGEVALDHLIQSQRDMDIVLVEGYKFSSIPKFEVIRSARSSEGVCRKETLIGRITDLGHSDDGIPSYALDEIEVIADAIEHIKKEVSHER
jgi:molybdate transport system ATP-binding protein